METTNNTVLITGGSSGIGLALAKRFWQEKNKVIIIGRDPTKLAGVQEKYPGLKTECVDIRDIAALKRLPQQYPEVNILINNAGVQYNYNFADPGFSLDTIENEINTNLLGPLYLTKLFLPHLLNKKQAAIVNVSSALGFVPKQTAPVYCGSKAAVHIFSQALRWQLENSSIKVFEIIPSLVDTPMTQDRDRNKISPEALADEFWHNFRGNTYEVRIGGVKQLLRLNQLMPTIAQKIMRKG